MEQNLQSECNSANEEFSNSPADLSLALEAGVSLCFPREIMLVSLFFPVLVTGASRCVPS